MTVRIAIYQASWNGVSQGLQVAIENAKGGYRLKGPKFGAVDSRLLTSVEIGPRKAEAIRSYLGCGLGSTTSHGGWRSTDLPPGRTTDELF